MFTLAPALVPLGAAAAGVGAGLAATGGAALLVFAGIRSAMEQGAATGLAYTGVFSGLKSELNSLESTAATNAFAGIDAGAQSLHALFPQLQRDTATFSGQLGTITGNVAPALVGLLTQLDPLFTTIGADLVRGSGDFEKWATSSQAVRNFVAYSQNELPAVEQTISALAVTASHLVQGLAPLGSTSLTSIRVLSQVINEIPVPVLEAVIPLIIGLKLGLDGLKVADNAAASIATFSTKLEKSSGAVSDYAGYLGGVGKAVSFLGPVGVAAGLGIGALTAIMGSNSEAAVEDTKRVNDLTEALKNGTAATTILGTAHQVRCDSGRVRARVVAVGVG